MRGEPGADGRLGLGGAEAVQADRIVAGIDGDTWVGLGGVERGVGGVSTGGDDADDRQTEDLGELEVALVVTGDRHDGAGAVAHQDVVGDPDRDGFPVHRVDRGGPGGDAGLRVRQVGAVEVALGRGAGAILLHRRAVLGGGQAIDQGMLGGEHHVGRAEEGVGPRGEDADDVGFGRFGGAARLAPCAEASESSPT